MSEPDQSSKEIIKQKLEKEFNRNARELPLPVDTIPDPVFLSPDPGINTTTDPRMP